MGESIFAQSLSSLLVGGSLAAGGLLLLATRRSFRARRSQAIGRDATNASESCASSATRTASHTAGGADSSSRPDPSTEAPNETARTGPAEALLAEDNDVNALILTRQLEHLGLCVTRVATGADAVAIADERRFDVVLLDWRMPEMDGLQAIRLLRRMPRHRATPIVVVTANALEQDRETCLDAGADAYLTKPVEIDALRSALAELSLLDAAAPPASNPT